ncbi:uncharacterized protein DUF1653 [Frigoribacterium sp. PhB160]|uniref:DUF1653 domain-containing protein n=1 Tax=Frigoribacterium sp. PhB160 TaxID=2485192 RepID=UPI000F4AD33A|nr:DUF1653 domain-containing protein [Frigoribacterium sp. PhB160]ROS58285.1 uncharacterized protein DUF1653 [Frigoribacterium sp. PhB160]
MIETDGSQGGQAAPPEPGTYRHFKGGRYEVVGTGRHTETDELLVFYRTLYDDRSHWVRPLDDFVGRVVRDGYDGPRFVREG